MDLRDVIVFNYKDAEQFSGRIDAEFASLEDGFWHITNAWVHIPNEQPRFEKDYWLATDLTLTGPG